MDFNVILHARDIVENLHKISVKKSSLGLDNEHNIEIEYAFYDPNRLPGGEYYY